MIESKFWTFLAVGLAVMAFFYKDVSLAALLLIGLLTVILCFIISYIWSKVVDSNHKWIDAVFFLFSKNKQPYMVVDKIINYSLLNDKEATYNLTCDLISKSKNLDFCYKGRYHWEQDDDIKVSVSPGFTYKCSEDFKWSNVDVTPGKNRIIHKGDSVKCGFSLENLKITKLSKHSYLSCKMIEKVRHLKLVATVPASLKPTKKAIFVVQNSFGDEISSEEITCNYNKETHEKTYEKTIDYPRRGRKYIIKWDYVQ